MPVQTIEQHIKWQCRWQWFSINDYTINDSRIQGLWQALLPQSFWFCLFVCTTKSHKVGGSYTLLWSLQSWNLSLHSYHEAISVFRAQVLKVLCITVVLFSESLLVVSSLGIQISTKFALGHTTATFYDWDQVYDLVINEAITMVRSDAFLPYTLMRCYVFK